MKACGSLLHIENLVFGYSQDHLVCKNLNLDLHYNDILGIMGPSGCGKSTLLRLISGFLRQQAGRIQVEGLDVSAWFPQRRPTSMVFQNAALFPYLTVYENLAFGLRVQKASAATIQQRVNYLLRILELENTRNVFARSLSGGQRQRVAIGRSLAVEPKVLLLDEPLASIDEGLRDDLRLFIRQLLKNRQTSAILVSHAFQDTASICDKIAFWEGQTLTEARAIEDWIQAPTTTRIAEMIGYRNIVPADWLHAVANQERDCFLTKLSSHFVLPEESIQILSCAQEKKPAAIVLRGILKSFRWQNTKRYAVFDVNGTLLETSSSKSMPEGTAVNLVIDKTSLIGVTE